MAEDEKDRRIEPRGGVVGSGMLTDPERIREIEAEAARRERAWRDAPKAAFGDVLSHTPVKEQERTDVYVPAPLKSRGEDEDDGDAAEEEAAEEGEGAEAAAEGEGPSEPDRPVSRLPPDPRMAALNRMLDAQKPAPVPEGDGATRVKQKRRPK